MSQRSQVANSGSRPIDGVLGGVQRAGHVGRRRPRPRRALLGDSVHQTAAVRSCARRQVERLLAEHLAGARCRRRR